MKFSKILDKMDIKDKVYSDNEYDRMIDELFHRFPTFQKAGSSAYKPGIANMEFFDSIAGHPHKDYHVIHVAGTNGKGSVSNMLASVLGASGMCVGLYTSPHILDFRERMRLIRPDGTLEYISKEYVWDFVVKWNETFDHLDLSFFEITTMMAMCWFSDMNVDAVVLETGLGGRLDSTNIVNPCLSVITNIGLDHCDLLGNTLSQIAYEKAGIIKPLVPVVVGESNPETVPVFERKVLYTNLPEVSFYGDRSKIMSLLTFADKVVPSLWDESLPSKMDLQGCYQKVNLRTVLAALDVLKESDNFKTCDFSSETVCNAIANTASRMEFHGRWEKLSGNPWMICDIGHNAHGLRSNFYQLQNMLSSGDCTHLVIVYGSVADKNVDAVMEYMPVGAEYIFTNADSPRSLKAGEVQEKYLAHCEKAGIEPGQSSVVGNVASALETAVQRIKAIQNAEPSSRPLIYIGGSTYVVSEAVAAMKSDGMAV